MLAQDDRGAEAVSGVLVQDGTTKGKNIDVRTRTTRSYAQRATNLAKTLNLLHRVLIGEIHEILATQ